jgi:hypothetical protein
LGGKVDNALSIGITILLAILFLIYCARWLGGKAGKKKAEKEQKEFLDNLNKKGTL